MGAPSLTLRTWCCVACSGCQCCSAVERASRITPTFDSQTGQVGDSWMLGATLDAAAYIRRLSEELDRVELAELHRWADLLFDAWKQRAVRLHLRQRRLGHDRHAHERRPGQKHRCGPSILSDESRRRLKVMSLTDNLGWILAVGNDCGYDQIFVQQLMNYGRRRRSGHRHQRLGQQPERAGRRRLGQPPRPESHSVSPATNGGKLRQLARHGAARPAGRHGHGREHSPGAVSLGAERRVCADQWGGAA